jgi:hypothetical protein
MLDLKEIKKKRDNTERNWKINKKKILKDGY